MRQSVGPVHIRSPISLARSVALAALLDVVSSHFFKTQNKGISLGGRETSAFKTLEQKLRISSVTRLLSFLCFQICFPIQRKSISRGFQRHLKPLGNQWLQEFDAINYSLKTYKRLNLFCLQPLMGPPISAIPARNPKFHRGVPTCGCLPALPRQRGKVQVSKQQLVFPRLLLHLPTPKGLSS